MFPFGFPIIPPPCTPSESFSRLGVEELECTINHFEAHSEVVIDSVFIELIYVSEKQIKEAYGFEFVYNDGEVCVSAPCTISYASDVYTISFTGWKLSTFIDPAKVSTCGHILFYKKGVLK